MLTRCILSTLSRLETCPLKTGSARQSTSERAETHLLGGEQERRGGERERREGELLRGRAPWSLDRIWSGVLRRCCAKTTSICEVDMESKYDDTCYLKAKIDGEYFFFE
jgi:hypothetical protein